MGYFCKHCFIVDENPPLQRIPKSADKVWQRNVKEEAKRRTIKLFSCHGRLNHVRRLLIGLELM